MKELIKVENLSFIESKRQEIKEAMENIKVVIVNDPETYKEAVLIKREAEKVKKDLERFRIDFNKEFTKVVKSLYDPIDLVIDNQGLEISEWDDKLNNEKLEVIVAHFITLNSPVDLERLFDNRYFNKTYDVKDACLDLESKVVKIKSDLDIIKMLSPEPRLKELYLKHLDITKAKELFDLENNNVVEVKEVGNGKLKYNLTFETDEETFAKIERFIQALGIELNEFHL
jgi:hypothetical protein